MALSMTSHAPFISSLLYSVQGFFNELAKFGTVTGAITDNFFMLSANLANRSMTRNSEGVCLYDMGEDSRRTLNLF